jgi:hypothetical protein
MHACLRLLACIHTPSCPACAGLCCAGSNGDLAVINGVLETANSIFKRYRDQYRSNELVHELATTQVHSAACGNATQCCTAGNHHCLQLVEASTQFEHPLGANRSSACPRATLPHNADRTTPTVGLALQ